jgi:hypothetical protein
MLAFIAIVALAQSPVVDNLNGVPTDAGPAAAATTAPVKQPPGHKCGTVEKKSDGTVDQSKHGCTAVLNVGEVAPFAGLHVDEQEDIFRTARESGKTAKLLDYETGNFIMPIAAYLGITGGAVAVALAVLSAVLAATGHLK